jgi:hypothetical protein
MSEYKTEASRWIVHTLGTEQAREGMAKRPFPFAAWPEALSSPVAHIPWPYTESEALLIKSGLPEEYRDRALEQVVLAARLWVRSKRMQLPDPPNPRREIEKLRAALDQLTVALRDLSPEAIAHLRIKSRQGRYYRSAVSWDLPHLRYLSQSQLNELLANSHPPTFGVSDLKLAIDRFEHENRRGLEDLPEVKRGGPRARPEEKKLLDRLRATFSAAHGGKRRRRGLPSHIHRWPDFMHLCVDPLDDFGLMPRDDKSWEVVTQK